MNIYDAMDAWGAAIQADATIKAYCIANFGRGLLVSIDQDMDKPLDSEDAPYLLMYAYSGGNDSPVEDYKAQSARIVCGTVGSGTPSTPVVTTERTETANGLRKFGAGNLAVDLLDLVLTAIKAVEVSDYSLLVTASYDVDGLLFFPLCVAGTTVQITEPRDLSM